jgi:dolichol-phosphate mannosyltransferase
MAEAPLLTIVMPAYNEEGCIAAVASQWLGLLTQIDPSKTQSQLIVGNDGSKDRTGAILDQVAKTDSRLRVMHKPNEGHGLTLLRLYREALKTQPQWVFHVDSDDQFKPDDFHALWQHRKDSKFILGYRRVRHDAFHRLIITRIVRLLNLALFQCYIPDANVPYRLIEGKYLARLLTALGGEPFAPNIFLAVLAARDKQKLFHFPVNHEDRKTGVVSIIRWKLIKVCLRSARELAAFRFALGSKLKMLR